MRRGRAAAVALGAVAVLAGACTIVDGLVVPSKTSLLEGGSGEAGASCSVTWPERVASTAPGTVQPEIIVAAHLSFGGEGEPVGWDLDGRCTCLDGGGPTAVRSGSCVSPAEHCDDARGRDNATRELFQILTTFYNIDKASDDAYANGRGALLIRVSDYNGLADDGAVTVSIFGSQGIRGTPSSDGGATYVPPRNDGTDPWTIDRAELQSESPPVPKNTGGGYVTGHTLVMRFDFEVNIGEGLGVKFNDGVLTAQIEPTDAGRFTITHGDMAGRWSTDAALRTLGFVVDVKSGEPFCENATFALTAKENVCRAADVTIERDAGTDKPCDALSIALAFSAVPAQIGSIVSGHTLTEQTCSDQTVLHCD